MATPYLMHDAMYYDGKSVAPRPTSGGRHVTDFVSEDQCAVCSLVPPIDRQLFRMDLYKIPLREPMCDACVMAFFRNIGFPVSDDEEPSGH
jgi:hypothetical protein